MYLHVCMYIHAHIYTYIHIHAKIHMHIAFIAAICEKQSLLGPLSQPRLVNGQVGWGAVTQKMFENHCLTMGHLIESGRHKSTFKLYCQPFY